MRNSPCHCPGRVRATHVTKCCVESSKATGKPLHISLDFCVCTKTIRHSHWPRRVGSHTKCAESSKASGKPLHIVFTSTLQLAKANGPGRVRSMEETLTLPTCPPSGGVVESEGDDRTRWVSRVSDKFDLKAFCGKCQISLKNSHFQMGKLNWN